MDARCNRALPEISKVQINISNTCLFHTAKLNAAAHLTTPDSLTPVVAGMEKRPLPSPDEVWCTQSHEEHNEYPIAYVCTACFPAFLQAVRWKYPSHCVKCTLVFSTGLAF